jgi:hypothetical protein
MIKPISCVAKEKEVMPQTSDTIEPAIRISANALGIDQS